MNKKSNYIGISNRIPIKVLDLALLDLLQIGKIDEEYFASYIREYTVGENRSKKTLSHIRTILNRNKGIISYFKMIDYQYLSEDDKYIFHMCLFCLTYPISYAIMNILSTGFKVQESISKKVILDKISSIYGSNRAMHIGVDESLPFIIEAKYIKRRKVGIYEKCETKKVKNSMILELILFTDITLSGTKSMLIDDVKSKSWYDYFDIEIQKDFKPQYFLQKKDGVLGNGYLVVKSF
jgi:hypothetical protein